MAHYLSEVTHCKLGQRPVVQESDIGWAKQPPSNEFDAYIRAMEIATRGPDGSQGVSIWTADQEGTVSIRNIKGEASYVIEKKKEVHVSALLAHGPYMWTGLSDGYLRIFDQKTYELCFERKQHSGRITCMISVGADVYTGSDDWQIYKWASKTFEPVRQLSGHRCSVLCLAHDGGDILFSGSEDCVIKCWDLERGIEEVGQGWPACQHTDGVTALVIREVHLFSASRDGTIKVWNTQTGAMVKFLDRREGPITCLLKDPSSQRIWAGGTDGIISVYDASSLKLVTRMRNHSGTYVKQLGLCVRLSALKVWSVNEDGIVKVWYADEDNEYGVYQERDTQLQTTVEDRRWQVIDNYRKIEEHKAHLKRLEDIDDKRKRELAVALGRKSENNMKAAYYNRVIQWLMKRRNEAKCRMVAESLLMATSRGTLSVMYHKLALFASEQKEARRKMNMCKLLLAQTQKGLQTSYWRNLLEYMRKTRANEQRSNIAGTLAIGCRNATCAVYFTKWTRWTRRTKDRKNRAKIAQAMMKNTEKGQVNVFWKKLIDFAAREKDVARKAVAAETILKRTEHGTRRVFWAKWSTWTRRRSGRNAKNAVANILATATEKSTMRLYWDRLYSFADVGGYEVLAAKHKKCLEENEEMMRLLAMQGDYTDEQIDSEMEKLELELADVLARNAEIKSELEDVMRTKADTRKKISQALIHIDTDASAQEQVKELMLLLKGKSVDCGLDFDHLVEAREDGKRIGPPKMYNDGIKKIKKVVATEAIRRSKEIGLDLTKDETCSADGEWAVVDSLDTFSKKSIRSAAAGIRDMIIAYDMMTVNPAALSKLGHNNEVIINAGLLLDIVGRVYSWRKGETPDREDGPRSRRRSSTGSKKRRASKSGLRRKSSVKKATEKKDGAVVKKSSKRSMSKKKSSMKKSTSKSPSRRSSAQQADSMARLSKPVRKKSSKKSVTKKKSTKKKSSKKSKDTALVKSTGLKLSKKKSSKKSTMKKKKSSKKSTKKGTKKKSTKKRTLKKKKVGTKKSTKKGTKKKSTKKGTKKSTKKKKVVKKSKSTKREEVSQTRSSSSMLRSVTKAEPAKKPWMGMMIQIDNPHEVVITNVIPGGPAHAAGFGDDDVLVNFGGQVVTDVNSFNAAFKAHAKVGAGVSVRVFHNGHRDQPVDAVLTVASVADKLEMQKKEKAEKAHHADPADEAAPEPAATAPVPEPAPEVMPEPESVPEPVVPEVADVPEDAAPEPAAEANTNEDDVVDV